MTETRVVTVPVTELSELEMLRFVVAYLGRARDHRSLVYLIDALDVASEQWDIPPWLAQVKELAEDELDSRDDL